MQVSIGRYKKESDPEGWGRKIKVKLHKFDTWNADVTLAQIIHPMLIQLRDTAHGYPAQFAETEHGGNGGGSNAWKIILDHMIWSFKEIIDDDYLNRFYNERKTENSEDKDWIYKVVQHENKIQEGLNNFSHYFRDLWD